MDAQTPPQHAGHTKGHHMLHMIGCGAMILAVVVIGLWKDEKSAPAVGISSVTPEAGVTLPVSWGDLGKQLVSAGVIDRDKFVTLYGSLTPDEKTLLDGSSGNLKITATTAPYILNLLWALGLGNANPILADDMTKTEYGGAGGFASTGGWTISMGDPMSHYAKHQFLKLTKEQQALVDKVSENIYRPCCDNPTHFPDCNHGMAMLALIELMVSQNRSEDEIYRAALTMNSYWFPSQYQTLAEYFQSKGVAWQDVSTKEVLGKDYSSASGYARIAALMQPKQQSGGSCSV